MTRDEVANAIVARLFDEVVNAGRIELVEESTAGSVLAALRAP